LLLAHARRGRLDDQPVQVAVAGPHASRRKRINSRFKD
jgi:hypothetical protein